MAGTHHNLWVSMGLNNWGELLIIIEKKEEESRRIFILEGPQARGW